VHLISSFMLVEDGYTGPRSCVCCAAMGVVVKAHEVFSSSHTPPPSTYEGVEPSVNIIRVAHTFIHSYVCCAVLCRQTTALHLHVLC
jgi:hypothetical protein